MGAEKIQHNEAMPVYEGASDWWAAGLPQSAASLALEAAAESTDIEPSDHAAPKSCLLDYERPALSLWGQTQLPALVRAEEFSS